MFTLIIAVLNFIALVVMAVVMCRALIRLMRSVEKLEESTSSLLSETKKLKNRLSGKVETPPMHYWQHDETGRVCATVLQPSVRWSEITQEQYDASSVEMKFFEPKR